MIKRISVNSAAAKAFIYACLAASLIMNGACGRKQEQAGNKPQETAQNMQAASAGSGKMVVSIGDKIKVMYTGLLSDGTVFDKSKEGQPLEFTVGSGQMIPGFDKAVVGMGLNTEKKVLIKSEDAYGKRNEKMIIDFPKANMPKDFKPAKGMVIQLQSAEGNVMPGTILEVKDKTLTIDMNHFLAGKDLTFEIKVISIE